MSYLSNKKILLTGAAGGFGAGYMRQLLHKGAHLLLSDVDEEMLADKASSISGAQGKTIACIGADLASPAGCQSLYSKAVEKMGDIDIVIHNAGILTYGYYHDAPVERLYQLMQVNTVAPMHLTSLFLPDMLRRGSGHVVFMSSVAGLHPPPLKPRIRRLNSH
jgi:short-subunit dehydrogenase